MFHNSLFILTKKNVLYFYMAVRKLKEVHFLNYKGATQQENQHQILEEENDYQL